MDTNKMREMKELAEAAGSDEWYAAGDLRYCDDKTGETHGLHHDDSRFIAAASPATVLALLEEIDRLATSRSKKERELEQELEVWHHGPFCWTCGDTGDVHDITGEWRGECDCLSSQVINANRERDQLKAENEALRKDAGRYRWLRDKQTFIWLIQDWFPGEAMLTNVDADIDAAMAKEASHDR